MAGSDDGQRDVGFHEPDELSGPTGSRAATGASRLLHSLESVAFATAARDLEVGEGEGCRRVDECRCSRGGDGGGVDVCLDRSVGAGRVRCGGDRVDAGRVEGYGPTPSHWPGRCQPGGCKQRFDARSHWLVPSRCRPVEPGHWQQSVGRRKTVLSLLHGQIEVLGSGRNGRRTWRCCEIGRCRCPAGDHFVRLTATIRRVVRWGGGRGGPGSRQWRGQIGQGRFTRCGAALKAVEAIEYCSMSILAHVSLSWTLR